MAYTRTDCILSAVRAGVSPQDAQDIVDFLMAEKARLKAQGQNPNAGSLGQAWQGKVAQLRQARARQRRLQDVAIIRRVEMEERIDAAMADGVSFRDALDGILIGSNSRHFGARKSVSIARRAIFNGTMEPLIREMAAVSDGHAMLRVREDKAFHDDVIREMRRPGSTGDTEARAIADAWARHAEDMRRRYNNAGGDVGRLDGWVPQPHDQFKLLKAGREKWIDDILPLLDRDRTFDGAPDAEARKILSKVYDTLTIGKNRWLDVDDPDGALAAGGERLMGAKNAANQFREHRVLHFLDGDAAVAYNDAYGRGNVFDAMVAHLDSMSRATALLEQLGPTPMRTIERLIAREESRIQTLDEARMPQEMKARELERLRALGAGGGMLRQGRVVGIMAELTGEINSPVNPTLARVFSGIRAVQSLSKLGGATLSAIADIFTKAAAMRCNGVTMGGGIMRSLADQLRVYGEGTDARIAAGQGGAFIDQVTRTLAQRWDADYSAPGILSDLQNRMFQWTGLNWITEHGKAGYTMWLSSHLGELHATDFAGIDPARRAILDWHGVDETRWNIWRKMMRQGDDGATYFLPVEADALPLAEFQPLLPDHLRSYQDFTAALQARNARNIPDAAAFDRLRTTELERLRDRVRTDAMAMLADETGFAVIEPDDATRAVMRQGTRPGTVAGELWRCIMQFKSFPIAYMQRILGGRRWVRGERQQGMARGFGAESAYGLKTFGDALGRDIPGVIASTLTALTFGYISMTLKDFAKGRTAKDPTRPETALAAALQSGGLGIFGDFLFAQNNRFGGSLAGSMAGPAAGTLIDGFGAIPSMLTRGEGGDAMDQFIRTALGTTPMINMWMIRTPLDFLLTYHIREWMSPGSLRKMERTIRRDFGQDHFLRPSSVIRRGGGFR